MIGLINVMGTLRRGNIDFLDMMECSNDKITTIKNIRKEKDCIEIFLKVLPQLMFKMHGKIIFDAIYDIPELRDYTYYLLQNEKVNVDEISADQLTIMLTNTGWGEGLILNNLDLILKRDAWEKIDAISKVVVNDETRCKNFLNKFIYEVSPENRILFITLIARSNKDMIKTNCFAIEKLVLENPNDYDTQQMVIPGTVEENKPKVLSHDNLMKLLNVWVNNNLSAEEAMYICDTILDTHDKNDLGKTLVSINHPQLKEYTLKNFERILNSSISTKMELLTKLRESLDSKVTDEYNKLIELFNMIDSKGFDCHQIFSNILNYNILGYLESLIEEYLDKSITRDITYLTHGTTTYVFRVGDYVLKIGNNRFCAECPEHFRIIRNVERKVVLDKKNNPAFFIEVQKYIDRSNTVITEEMIYQLFVDLKKSGIELTDPIALDYRNDNFALLSDYREANVSDSSSYDGLPSEFKENPLVVIDVDLIYTRTTDNKKYFQDKYFPSDKTMDEVIEHYEFTKRRKK